MFDAAMRSHLEKPLNAIGGQLSRAGVTPNAVTALGLAAGVAACVAIALDRWWVGLVLWLVNRIADGLDGPVARHRGATDLGGFYDILTDFAIYGGVLVAIGIARPDARLACLGVLLSYYVSGSSFLAFSSLAAKRDAQGDGRSLHFPAGLAEGTETIVAYILILSFPDQAVTMLWVWCAMVAITALQRLIIVARFLRV